MSNPMGIENIERLSDLNILKRVRSIEKYDATSSHILKTVGSQSRRDPAIKLPFTICTYTLQEASNCN